VSNGLTHILAAAGSAASKQHHFWARLLFPCFFIHFNAFEWQIYL